MEDDDPPPRQKQQAGPPGSPVFRKLLSRHRMTQEQLADVPLGTLTEWYAEITGANVPMDRLAKALDEFLKA